ncbi:hypothetical protein [Merismopedia glauca]
MQQVNFNRATTQAVWLDCFVELLTGWLLRYLCQSQVFSELGLFLFHKG